VKETANPVLESAEPVVGGALRETTKPVEESAGPLLDKANETLAPVTRPVEEAAAPVLESAEKTLEPIVEPVKVTANPVVGTAGETLEPVVEPVAKTLEPTLEPGLGLVHRTAPAAVVGGIEGTLEEPGLGGVAPPPVGPEPVPSPPVTGATMPPAAGTASPAPVAALGTPRGADVLTIGLSPSESAAANASSLAWEHPGTFAVATKESMSNAWGVRGPPAVVARLSALIAAAQGLWAETLARLLSGGLLADGLSVASGASVPSGGSAAPLPAAPSPAGSSTTGGLGSSVGGGLGLGILALLLALSPLGVRLLRHPQNFLRPNSALVLAIERPG
jgi:hypothetical protein